MAETSLFLQPATTRRQGDLAAGHVTGDQLRRVCAHAADTLRTGWCKGEAAIDSRGNPAHPAGNLAWSWCLVGSIDRACVTHGLDVDAFEEVLERVCEAVGLPDGEALGDWNDAPERRLADCTRALADASAGVRRRAA